MSQFQIHNQERQALYNDIAQALAPVFELREEEVLTYNVTSLPNSVIDGILAGLDYASFDIAEAAQPAIVAALKGTLAGIAVADMTNLPTAVSAVMADYLSEESRQAFAKVVEGSVKKILVPRQIALAVSEPVAQRVEEWLQRLVAGLRAQDIPDTYKALDLLGKSVEVEVDQLAVREVVYAPDQE